MIHHDAKKILSQIDYFFRIMKPESMMGDPDIYLGCKLRLHTIAGSGVQAWLQSPSKYIQQAVRNTETYYTERFQSKVPTRVSSPFATGLRWTSPRNSIQKTQVTFNRKLEYYGGLLRSDVST